MDDLFIFNERLGISIPTFLKEWDEYERNIQQSILLHWENIRGSIPDRIRDLETVINHKQSELTNENDFNRSCELNFEISDLASIINDLWLWYRTQQDVSDKKIHS